MDIELLKHIPSSGVKRLAANDPSIAFTIKLASALHQYGTPSHRLEEAMSRVFLKLGLEGTFFSTPTGLFASFGAPEEQRTSLIRVDPGDVNLEKMSLLDDLAGKVIRGEMSPEEGSRQVEEIVASPSRYGPVLTAICFGLASGSACRFIGGGWRELVAATGIGLMLGLLAILASRFPGIGRVYEPVSAMLASALAVLAAHIFSPISVYVTTLAGLIILVPGLTLTIAMTELATKNLVSGTARLTGAILLFLEIGFGVALGSQINRVLPHVFFFNKSEPLPSWTLWLALMVSPLTFTVLFRARPKDVGWIFLAGLIGFQGTRLGGYLLGAEFGVCLGALMVGMGSNLFARYIHRPAAIPLVPGIMLLVPGSVGYGSMAKFLEKDVVSGVETAFKMVLISIALVTGLLLANVTVPPRKAL